MRRNPERIAWTVLLISFSVCVSLVITVPLAVRAFVTESIDPATRVLQVQQGTVLLELPNSSNLAAVTDATADLPDGATIKVDQFTQAILTVRDAGNGVNLAIVQLYANTELTLRQAVSPRFGPSPNPHRIDLTMSTGRIRINLPPDTPRATAVSVKSPQGDVRFNPGTYSVEVTNEETQVTAREGSAIVSAQGSDVTIEALQRAEIELGQPPRGGLSGERNLVANGGFTGSLNPAWAVEHGPQDADEPTGNVTITTVSGRRAGLFERVGDRLNHAETRLVQQLNRDVTDAASLTLHFAVLVESQDVPICGFLGSECPMMVRIEYRDTSGANREWVQGFYLADVPDPLGSNPRVCETCSTRNAHRPLLPNAWFAFDSGNLMDELAVGDLRPAWISRIVFYASGHAYKAALTDVELLVQD
jgi:hypothetical protein